MRDLRANESIVIGVLGAFGVLLILAAFFILPARTSTTVIFSVSVCQFALMAWFGLRANRVFVDGDDLLVETKGDLSRFPTGDVMSIRTWPALYYFSVLSVRLKSGVTFGALVREQDLTWIMSQMPVESITLYWRRRIG
jgi:hypothetical protein